MMDRKEALQVIEENLAVDYGNLDHEQTKRLDEAIDMAIGALKAQAERTEERTETHACDLISRKATIDAMENVDWYHISKDGRLVHGANSDDHEPLYKAKDVYAVLNTMPSAQPEKRTEERTETHACDCISRQAAIDAVYKCSDIFVGDMPVMVVKADAYEALAQLPSAQPEVLACGEGELIAQPEIIRCNDCKHWTQTTGNMRGFGLGDCDYINAKLVNCNGFCYWAERRTDERQT